MNAIIKLTVLYLINIIMGLRTGFFGGGGGGGGDAAQSAAVMNLSCKPTFICEWLLLTFCNYDYVL